MRNFPTFVCVAVTGLAMACKAPEEEGSKKPPGENFQHDTSVTITSPTNGETVEPSFMVRFIHGEQVSSLRLDVDGTPVEQITGTEGAGSVEITVGDGRHQLELLGLDRGGAELSSHSLTFRATDSDVDWVTITSPADGAVVNNPVHFAVEAASNIETIEILADGWTLGEVSSGEILTYAFEGTGFEREIVANAWSDGEIVATDTVAITVDAGVDPGDDEFNDLVIDYLETYPTDGSYTYYWPDDSEGWAGNPSDIYYLGDLFAAGDPYNRSYCVGMTFEVFMRSFDSVDASTGGDGTINGIDFDELYTFRTDWYVRELNGAGVVDAIENYGIGVEVTDWDDVRPGDFVQFWRHSGSGHNVIFIDWTTDSSGAVEGFEYWSTQGSTDGVGYNIEEFGSTGGSVDPNLFFAGRVSMPADWSDWN